MAFAEPGRGRAGIFALPDFPMMQPNSDRSNAGAAISLLGIYSIFIRKINEGSLWDASVDDLPSRACFRKRPAEALNFLNLGHTPKSALRLGKRA